MEGYGNRKIAIERYFSVPKEMDELYKKHSIPVRLPDAPYFVEETQDNARRIEEFASSIEEKLKIRFDAVISCALCKSNSDLITITKPEVAHGKESDGGGLDNSEGRRLASYINANARRSIFINTPGGGTGKLKILFVNDCDMPIQVSINVEEKGMLNLFEYYASVAKSGSIMAPLHEVHAMKGSEVEISMLHNENEHTKVISLIKGDALDNSKLGMNFIYNGATETKAINILSSNGDGSRVHVNEIVYGSGDQKFDINTYIANSKPRSHALLESGAVLDGNSLCILKGFADINKWTKGAKSRITQRGILASENAHIDALPDMKIDYSDEVSATHSAATSPIDKEALFYLNSRGIPEDEARKLFISAFAMKYMMNISEPFALELASSIVLGRIEGREFGSLPELSPKGIWIPVSASR